MSDDDFFPIRYQFEREWSNDCQLALSGKSIRTRNKRKEFENDCLKACDHSDLIKKLIEIGKEDDQPGLSQPPAIYVDYQSALFRAILSKQEDTKKDIIYYCHAKNNELVHSQNVDGQTAILMACFVDLKTVKILEELGAKLDDVGKFGQNGLMNAATKGNNDIIKYLHSKNSKLIHGQDCVGDTALILAIKYGKLDTVKLLLKLGSNIDQTDEMDGYSMSAQNGMFYAVDHDSAEKRGIIRYLHSKNSELIDSINKESKTVLDKAREYGYLETIDLLLELGAKESRTRSTTVVLKENEEEDGPVAKKTKQQ